MINEKSIGKLILRGRKGWLYLFGSWTIVALFLSGHNIAIRLSMGGDFQIHNILLGQMFHYYYAALCPLVYRISCTFYLKRHRWVLLLLTHALMIAVMLLGLWLFIVLVTPIINPAVVSLTDSIQRQLKFSTIVYLTTASIVYYFIMYMIMSIIRLNRQKQLQEKHTGELQQQAADLKNQLMQAKLQTLQMQLQPHFFFNALNSISSLIQNNQNQAAYDAIVQLGTLMRSTLELPTGKTIPLSNEIEIINSYLDIEKLRFPDRLSIKYEIPKICQNSRVPSLILQPLVENCIRHVVSRSRKKIQITISAEKKESKLLLSVSDNGPGLPEDWSMNHKAGIGIKNLRERLKVMYKDKFDFIPISKKSSGLTVKMVIPFTSNDREHA